jgi:quercetin dioxygenase-like cupin family protein
MTRYPAVLRLASAIACATAMVGVAVAQDKPKPAPAPAAAPAPAKDVKTAPAAKDEKATGPQHSAYNQSELKWGDAPPSLPKGAKLVVLNGDPGKAGPFVIRDKFPAGYKVSPHFHGQDENLTVISGTLVMGTGDKADEKGGHALKAGGYSYMPAKTHHYVIAKSDTVIQVSGTGPFDVTYINPADDPRNAAKK